MNMNSMTTLVTLIIIALGYISPIYQEQIRTAGFFALSGAITNWLAIHMLFERVPGLYGSGVIPLHFEDFKKGIRELIMKQFFTPENVSRLMEGEARALSQKINPEKAADAVNYDLIFDGLQEALFSSSIGSMLGMFGGTSVIENFRSPFKEKTRTIIIHELSKPDFISKLTAGTTENTDKTTREIIEKVSTIVQKRLDELTPKMVKEIIQAMIKKHLGWLVLWGGVFGGFIGLVMSLFPL